MAGLFDGKVVLVTGGSSGIGRATALAFAEEGAKVVIADVQVDRCDDVAMQIREMGSEVMCVETDVSDDGDVEMLINQIVEKYGRLDCAFNNAGIEGKSGTVAETTDENWERVINVNLKGVWLCMKHEIPHMLKHGGGAIVNTASIAGLIGFENLPAYVASKHGVNGLTKTAALEYAQKNIRVNAISPGVIRTPMVERSMQSDAASEEEYAQMTPMGRMGKPEEIAHAVVWLCSDKASFVTGHIMVVDGGFTAR